MAARDNRTRHGFFDFTADRVDETGTLTVATRANHPALYVLLGASFGFGAGILLTLIVVHHTRRASSESATAPSPTETSRGAPMIPNPIAPPMQPLTPTPRFTFPEASSAGFVRILSSPLGVEVYDEDDVLLGNTPLEVERPRGNDVTRLVLRAPAHRPEAIAITRHSVGELTLRLVRQRTAPGLRSPWTQAATITEW